MRILSILNRVASGIFFRKIDLSDKPDFISNYSKKFFFKEFETSFLQGVVKKNFEHYNQNNFSVGYQFTYNGTCRIEPKFGWILIGNKFIAQSFSHSQDYPPPSVFSTFFYKKIRTFKRVVSIQYRWDNYYHFYNDVLGQIAMMEQAGLPLDIPVIIPRRALERTYVREAFELSPFLKNINWIELEYGVKVEVTEQVIVFKNHSFIPSTFLHAFRYFNIPPAQRFKHRNLFLKRNASRPRSIANFEEIEGIAMRNGFEIVDADQFTLKEQIKIFAEARYVCGIHGAGLTNIIFRHKLPCSLLEIFPANYIMPNYYWLAVSLGFSYCCFVSDAEEGKDRSFKVDSVQFEKALLEFLSHT